MKPAREIVAGRDILVGPRPMANSVSAFASGVHVRELVGSLFTDVIEATINHDLGLARENSIRGNFEGLESSCTGNKLLADFLSERLKTYQAPTGIFTGPLEDIRRRLIHPAVVLMNLGKRLLCGESVRK